jgi:hypothetical protein
MSKKFLKTSTIVCLSVILCLTVYQTNAYSMMSDAELEQCVKGSSVKCSQTGRYTHGHNPKKAKEGIQWVDVCPECNVLKQRIAAHNAAVAKKAASDNEEAELRKELLRAQIAAVKK